MTINPTIRQLKIAMITDQPNDILSWFKDLCSKLHTKNARVYNNHGTEHIYYFQKTGKDDTLEIFPIFYLDYHTKSLLADYRHYWAKIEQEFDLDYDDIVEVTKYLAEYVLNIKAKYAEGEALYYNKAMIDVIKNQQCM